MIGFLTPTHSKWPASLWGGVFCGALLALTLPSCLGGGGNDVANVPGTGRAEFFLESIEWGRLVDVFDRSGKLADRDVLVRQSLQDVPGQYTFGLNPITQSETLTLDADLGTPEFQSLLDAAMSGREAIATHGLGEPGTYSLVGRNGVIRLQFSELVDPSLVTGETIKVEVGDPPTQNQTVRYLVRNDQVGADGKPKGVVILDPTISKIDEANLGIPQNGTGYPPSFDSVSPNVVIRIPTTVDVANGQLQVLRNLSGNHTLQPRASDPVELSPGLDPIVVRAFRTGNDSDPYNGFMVDQHRPQLVTEQEVAISAIAAVGDLTTLTYSITAVNCRRISPKVGDVFEVGTGVLLVSRVDDQTDPAAYVVSGPILVGEAEFPPGNHSADPLAGKLTSVYESRDSDLQTCWLEFSPAPEFGLPARGIDPYSSVTFRFSEPIDVATVKSLETVVVASYLVNPPVPGPGATQEELDAYAARQFDPAVETVGDYIDRQLGYQTTGSGSGRVKFGPVEASADARTFTLTPSAGFADSHQEGNDFRLCLALRDGPDGVLDLAGNQLDAPGFVAGNDGQSEQITPGSFSPWPIDRYFSLRFNSTDENGDGLSEYGGQFRFDNPGFLRGRSLDHFTRSVDTSNSFIAQRATFSQGLMTPLTPAGAVLHTCWAYHHMGFGLQVVSTFNLDVEGLNWAPFGGSVFDDTFARFSIALSHSDRFPDDYINPGSGFPQFINSGLKRNGAFDQNILGFPDLDEVVVTDGFYRLTQSKVYSGPSGTKWLPWSDFTKTYTWRDTGIPANDTLDGPGYRGGKNSYGAPPEVVSTLPPIYPPEQIPSIGLPLLARFRCYPRGDFFGANGFQVQIMVGSTALPAFRVYSAGGRDSGGTWHLVIPDDPGSGGTEPNGGYNTSTGFTTKAFGPELYWEDIDFVTRISRVYTHWFPFGGIPTFISAITQEPTPSLQPPGTSVVIEVRGSTTVDNDTTGTCSSGPIDDAGSLDLYGDYTEPCGNAAVAMPTGWRSGFDKLLNDPLGLDYQYFQIRFTFVSNIDQDLFPELDAFGFAWNIQ